MAQMKKLTVNVSEELVDVLRELAARSGSTMTEELKRAISDRKYFVDKVDAGNGIFLIPEEPSADREVQTQVVLR